MRYFTRGWANGELADDAAERAGREYRARLEAIADQLPEAASRLAHHVSLHDAVIEAIRWRAERQELEVTLAAGTSESGYSTVALTYLGAQLGPSRVDTLRTVARDRETEVLYDEVDVDDGGLMVHRLLFWPRDEVTIEFRELRLQVSPRADRRVCLAGAFEEIAEAP